MTLIDTQASTKVVSKLKMTSIESDARLLPQEMTKIAVKVFEFDENSRKLLMSVWKHPWIISRYTVDQTFF